MSFLQEKTLREAVQNATKRIGLFPIANLFTLPEIPEINFQVNQIHILIYQVTSQLNILILMLMSKLFHELFQLASISIWNWLE